jgi:uncharacterized protein YbjQ (UPF0145 family)
VDAKLISTGFELPGYRVTETLGIVRGVASHVRGVVEDLGSVFEALRGKASKTVENLEDQSREDALLWAIRKAEERGANALLGVRYDTFAYTDRQAEVVCYGTAARVERLDQREVPATPSPHPTGAM